MAVDISYREGNGTDDAACGLVRAAASVASPVFQRLPGAQDFLRDLAPQDLGGRQRFVASIDDLIVGFTDFDMADGYVKMLFVEPAQQGQGIAGRLLHMAAEAAAAPLHLHTQAVNDDAIAFYLGQRFQITGGRVEADWHGARVVWLRLERPGP